MIRHNHRARIKLLKPTNCIYLWVKTTRTLHLAQNGYMFSGGISLRTKRSIFSIRKVGPKSTSPVVFKYMFNSGEIVDFLSLVKCPLILFLKRKKKLLLKEDTMRHCNRLGQQMELWDGNLQKKCTIDKPCLQEGTLCFLKNWRLGQED